jgi:hypothetical protein
LKIGRLPLIHVRAAGAAQAQSVVSFRPKSKGDELDASRIEASLKHGVLKLGIPKLEEAKPRRIEVRVD